MSNELDWIVESPSDTHFADADEPPRPDVERFFKVLYAGQSGVLELRTVPKGDTPAARRYANAVRDFVLVHDGQFDVRPIQRFLTRTEARGMAAYFGVALRTANSLRDRKGDGPHCQWLTALFVDCDFKRLNEAEIRRRLAAFPKSPSVIVNSGGGLHVYWLLHHPFDLQQNFKDAQAVLRRLAHSIAEIADTNVSEPARVLRIPGSYNFKYDTPRQVVVEAWC
jgi:hypothetical protein